MAPNTPNGALYGLFKSGHFFFKPIYAKQPIIYHMSKDMRETDAM